VTKRRNQLFYDFQQRRRSKVRLEKKPSWANRYPLNFLPRKNMQGDRGGIDTPIRTIDKKKKGEEKQRGGDSVIFQKGGDGKESIGRKKGSGCPNGILGGKRRLTKSRLCENSVCTGIVKGTSALVGEKARRRAAKKKKGFP